MQPGGTGWREERKFFHEVEKQEQEERKKILESKKREKENFVRKYFPTSCNLPGGTLLETGEWEKLKPALLETFLLSN